MTKNLTAKSILLLCLLYTQSVFGQAICGNELIEQKIEKDANLKSFFDEYYKQYAAENSTLSSNRALNKGTADNERYIIPVVFHIVLRQDQIDQIGKEAGIIERINSQLAAVNADFAGTNADISKVPNAFKDDIGIARIHFELAKRDANGNPKIGIDYKVMNSSFTGFSPSDNSVKQAGTGLAPWNHNLYLNIWVTEISSGGGGGNQVLGYGYNPVYASQVHLEPKFGGIVMHYLTFGKKEKAGQHFFSKNTLGRTLTHELGHFFNIWHIWGRSVAAGTKDCSKDDGIDDTPLQEESNFNCPGFTPNCPSQSHPGGEMYMNFMDYSGDSCVVMFTKDQVARMRTELAPGGQVHSLSQNQILAFWPNDISRVEYGNDFSMAPNPTNGKFNINLVKKTDILEAITITNTLGQNIKNIEVSDQSISMYTVDISAQPEGIYLIRLHFDQGIITRKVVLQ